MVSADYIASSLGYNPCFSGSSSATEYEDFGLLDNSVSYNPCFSGSSSATQNGVLRENRRSERYNPCFSGSSSATKWIVYPEELMNVWLQSLFFWQL